MISSEEVNENVFGKLAFGFIPVAEYQKIIRGIQLFSRGLFDGTYLSKLIRVSSRSPFWNKHNFEVSQIEGIIGSISPIETGWYVNQSVSFKDTREENETKYINVNGEFVGYTYDEMEEGILKIQTQEIKEWSDIRVAKIKTLLQTRDRAQQIISDVLGDLYFLQTLANKWGVTEEEILKVLSKVLEQQWVNTGNRYYGRSFNLWSGEGKQYQALKSRLKQCDIDHEWGKAKKKIQGGRLRPQCEWAIDFARISFESSRSKKKIRNEVIKYLLEKINSQIRQLNSEYYDVVVNRHTIYENVEIKVKVLSGQRYISEKDWLKIQGKEVAPKQWKKVYYKRAVPTFNTARETVEVNVPKLDFETSNIGEIMKPYKQYEQQMMRKNLKTLHESVYYLDGENLDDRLRSDHHLVNDKYKIVVFDLSINNAITKKPITSDRAQKRKKIQITKVREWS